MLTDITFIGLGRMGSALARCFLQSGKSLTVFNRSPDKTAQFEGEANIAASAAEACEQSPLTVMCVSDYASAQSILDDTDVIGALKGRTLVQMSSGSPEDARCSEVWADQHGIGYIDGGIVSYPAGVGTDGAIVMFAGDEAKFEAHRETLLVLATIGVTWVFSWGSNLGILKSLTSLSVTSATGLSEIWASSGLLSKCSIFSKRT